MQLRALWLLVGSLAFADASAAPPSPAPGGAPSRAAQPTPSFDRATYGIPHQTFRLPNGLTVLVHEDHSVPIVGVNLWYHVGSRNERRGKTGFAHLFEHFFFNGSENHPHGFREAMDDLGANNRNGTTSADRTNFFEDVPVPALERTLYLEADRMGFLAGHISKEMLERERGVVQNEKRQGENQPYGRVFDHILEALYPHSHPYSWSTIGSMEDLGAASLEDVKEWYRTYYGPNNCVLALAGDITLDRARTLAEKYFGGIPPGPPLARAESWVPRLDSDIRAYREDRVAEARIYRVYHVPGWRDTQSPLIELLAGILSGSRSGRLDRRLVYEKELATEVSAFSWDRELASLLFLTATVKEGKDPAVVEREMDLTVSELLKTGPTAVEVSRVQQRLLADFVRGTERLGGFGGRADVLAESMTYGGHPEAYLDRLERLARARPADVKALAQRWLDEPHYTLLVAPFPKLSPGPTAVDRKVLPALDDAPDVHFPALQRARLSNGLAVVLLERHNRPLVNVALAVDAGSSADSADQAGTAALALDLLPEGTARRDAFQIADALDALGARLATRTALDLSVVSLGTLRETLLPSLEIFADVIRHPTFPAAKVTIGRERLLARIRQEETQPVSAALRVIPRLIYGEGHPYAKPMTGSGTTATVEKLTRDRLVAWHRAWFQPGSSTVVVTGAVTLKDLLPALEQALGSWPKGQAPRKTLTAASPAGARRVYLIDKPGAPQSVIVATHVSLPAGQAEDLALETTMRNFGGMATSRLNRNLRLEKHWSYGTSGRVVDARGPRPFLVVAPVQTDKTKEAILEIAKEIRGVAGARPVQGEELASVLRSATLRLPGRFETLEALESAALQIVNYGYPDDYFARYAANARALREGDLAEAARRFVRPDDLVWLIVGDLAKVEAGIRELGLGDVVRLPATGEATP